MDALTTANQNQAVAINAITKVIQYEYGNTTSKTYDDASSGAQPGIQLATTSGRLVNVCVVIQGAGDVKFYNTASMTSLLAENLLFVLDAAAPTGVTPIGLQFSDGLVMVVGTGVSANATFSVGII